MTRSRVVVVAAIGVIIVAGMSLVVPSILVFPPTSEIPEQFPMYLERINLGDGI